MYCKLNVKKHKICQGQGHEQKMLWWLSAVPVSVFRDRTQFKCRQYIQYNSLARCCPRKCSAWPSIYISSYLNICVHTVYVQYPAFPTESLVLFILFLLVDDQTKIKESVLVCVNCHSLLLSVEDSAKPDSALSRTALSLTQLCPGQRSAWLISVPDSAQPDSSRSRTALSLAHFSPWSMGKMDSALS